MRCDYFCFGGNDQDCRSGCLSYSTSIIINILERAFLSRSGIMRILAQLRSGGYITIKNGVLKNVMNLLLD
ncbi:helix-turn-helix domain-containing protein [Lelliottia sp.]|uniref:helix-turn-helix domain-containing protein n=1 Tax=Lelliottia sp. TaxID=1898429 RepID=UPI00388D5F55